MSEGLFLGLGRPALARHVADGFEGGFVVYGFFGYGLDFGNEKPLFYGWWCYSKDFGHFGDSQTFHKLTIADAQKKIKKKLLFGKILLDIYLALK